MIAVLADGRTHTHAAIAINRKIADFKLELHNDESKRRRNCTSFDRQFRRYYCRWHCKWISSYESSLSHISPFNDTSDFVCVFNALQIIVDRHLAICVCLLTICLFLDIFDWWTLNLVSAGTHKSHGWVVRDNSLSSYRAPDLFCRKTFNCAWLKNESSLVFIVSECCVYVETRWMCTIAIWNATNSGDV